MCFRINERTCVANFARAIESPRLKLKAHFHDKEQPSDEPQRDEFESLKPKKSN